MSDNLPNIGLPVNEWVDLYQLTGIEVGIALSIENIGVCDVYLAVQAVQPDTDHESYNVISRRNGVRLQNNSGDPGAWAFCNSTGGKISVQPVAETGFYPHGNIDIKHEGSVVSPDNPLPTINYDSAHRNSVNSIFGDKITGARIPSIAAQFQYGLRADDAIIDTVTTGNTTISNSMLLLNTGVAADGHVGIQGADYLRYIPGHEAYAFFTCVFDSPVVGSIQRIGLFDFDSGNGNGFFVGYRGTQFGITRRRAGTDSFTPVDLAHVFPEDAGVFDPTKGNVYKISYGYLGFATIHFELLLPHGGFIELSSIDYPNTDTETHIANANIPLRAEMTNSGSTTDLQMKIGSVSAGIVDGGGADPIARIFTFALPTTTLVAGVVNQLITFRNKSTFFGITNKISTQLKLISAATDGNKPVRWGIRKNPDEILPGTATWTDVSVDSVMEYSTDFNGDLATGGDSLLWNMARADSFFEDVENLLVKLRPNQWATIYAISQNANDIDLSIRWKELF